MVNFFLNICKVHVFFLSLPQKYKGDARADSDIDVLVLLEGEARDLKREEAVSGALYDLELSTGVLISPMIMLRKLWENRPFKTPFYINVMNEGITL